MTKLRLEKRGSLTLSSKNPSGKKQLCCAFTLALSFHFFLLYLFDIQDLLPKAFSPHPYTHVIADISNNELSVRFHAPPRLKVALPPLLPKTPSIAIPEASYPSFFPRAERIVERAHEEGPPLISEQPEVLLVTSAHIEVKKGAKIKFEEKREREVELLVDYKQKQLIPLHGDDAPLVAQLQKQVEFPSQETSLQQTTATFYLYD